MKSKITLSKKEKLYNSLYLFLLLVIGVLLLLFLFFRLTDTPMQKNDFLGLKNVEDLRKVEKRQQKIQPKIDSLFEQMNRVSTKREFDENKGDFEYDLHRLQEAYTDLDVPEGFKNRAIQSVSFYRLYFTSKETYFSTIETREDVDKNVADCKRKKGLY